MKTIALIDTRSEVPGVSLGILVSTHPNVMAAFAANDAFQQTEASGRHIRTKIVTLKGRLDVGQPVQPAHLAGKQINQIHSTEAGIRPTCTEGDGIQGCSETRDP
jgi:hypothetical protein